MNTKSSSLSTRTSSIEEVHSATFFEFIGHVGFKDNQEIRSALKMADIGSSDFIEINPITIAIKAKIFSIEGNLIDALRQFKIAHHGALTNYNRKKHYQSDNLLAYIKFEYAVFYKKIFEFHLASDLLLEAKYLATDSNLCLLIDYELLLIELEHLHSIPEDEVIKTLELIEKRGILVTYIFGYLRLGEINRKLKKYPESKKYYSKAIGLAKKYNYSYLEQTINNSIGLIELSTGDIPKAIKTLSAIVETTKSFYLKSLAMENIALAYILKDSKEIAINYAHEALTISLDHGVFDRIPGQAMFIGDVYIRKFQQPERAEYFYKTACDHALSLAENGLPLHGQRMQAVKRYMDFIKQHPRQSNANELTTDVFSFALGKSWSELTDIFKFNLIVYHRQLHRKMKAILNNIDLTLASFNSKQNRLKRNGFVLPNLKFKEIKYDDPRYSNSLQDYIRRMKNKTWSGALKTFEKEVMIYLYSNNNYNKRKLSKAIDFSYSHTLIKMKELEIPSNK